MKPKSDTTIYTNKRNAMDSERDRNKSASLDFCLVSLQIDIVHMGVLLQNWKRPTFAYAVAWFGGYNLPLKVINSTPILNDEILLCSSK